MAEGDDETSKTEAPTGKRLGEARNEGNIPISRDVCTWVMLLGVVMTVSLFIPALMPHMLGPMMAILAKAGEIEITQEGFPRLLGQIFGEVMLPVFVLIMCILLTIALSGWLAQIGPMFNTSLVGIKFAKLNPMQGLKKLFNSTQLFDLWKSVVKIIIIGWVAYDYLKPAFMHMDAMAGLDNLALVGNTYSLTCRIFFGILLAFTVVALIDLFYQRFTYFKNLRMTRSEVKQEFRQTEGDPQVKNRLRSLRIEKARKRMMAAVPKADVVITNPTHFAIALKYEAGVTVAPVVLAKGQDFIAAKIREIATENDIPLVSNPPLARALYATVEIDEEIPAQHYRAVAEVISYVFRLRKPKR